MHHFSNELADVKSNFTSLTLPAEQEKCLMGSGSGSKHPFRQEEHAKWHIASLPLHSLTQPAVKLPVWTSPREETTGSASLTFFLTLSTFSKQPYRVREAYSCINCSLFDVSSSLDSFCTRLQPQNK